MIRILSNMYTDEEKQALFDLLNEMDTMFNECYCNKRRNKEFDCRLCELRHLCYDIEKIVGHSEELLK